MVRAEWWREPIPCWRFGALSGCVIELVRIFKELSSNVVERLTHFNLFHAPHDVAVFALSGNALPRGLTGNDGSEPSRFCNSRRYGALRLGNRGVKAAAF
jgi:hypothetical protein